MNRNTEDGQENMVFLFTVFIVKHVIVICFI